MIVQACLNGSRAIGFHQRLPITSEDIANDGASCIAAGAAELHLHPRGATGKESLAAVDTAILSLRGACPGTLIGVSTGAWIENDAVHTRNCIDQWSELPDYASVNSAIMIATASSEVVSVSMRKLRMRPAACSTCDLRHSARRKNVRRGQ